MTTPVNLFFKKEDIDKSLSSKEDPSTAYIILQNNMIHKKYIDLVAKYNSLLEQKERLDDDYDALSKGRICLQGHVKNEFNKSICYKKLYEMHRRAYDRLTKQHYGIHGILLMTLLSPLLSMSIYQSFTLMATLFSLQISSTFVGTKVINTILDKQTIFDCNVEISDIENSSKLLEDIIDNI